MMRVLHVCPTYFEPESVIAGAERYSYELAKAMARRTPTTLVTFGDREFVRMDGPLRVRCYRRWVYAHGNRMNPVAPAFIREVLASDIVHCHQYKTIPTDIAVVMGRLTGRKVFITDLAGSAELSLSYHIPLWRSVDEFLLISKYNERLFPDITPNKKSVIYGGVDTSTFKPDGRERDGSILFVGRLMPHKGLENLFAAMHADSKAIVVGRASSTDYADALRKSAEGKQVTFHEGFTDAQLLTAYRTSSVVVLPSLADGGYTTALEAMACEVPVIGTAVGSLPELVQDGETGFIVPPNDALALRERLRWVLDNPDEGTALGKAGRRRVETLFTWDHVVDRCFDRYQAHSTGSSCKLAPPNARHSGGPPPRDSN